jgi:endonuclease/exonuclease/phosphatase family metal-dependent hydrolase
MNRYCFFVCLSAMVAFGAQPFRTSAEAAASADADTNSIPLCVMSFNLRYASSQSPNSWPERRPVMRGCIRSVAPDLIGTQEGLYPQLKDIATALPEYNWIGVGRDGGSHGEFMAIFYRRDRFEPMEFDHFWLSDTPEVIGSASWGNTNRRMVTWVRFNDRQTGREFYFWNTHLDQAVEAARQKGAALIRQRIEALKTNLPTVLTGDFNSLDGNSAAWNILVKEGGLLDTWPLAREHVNERLNSFHGYREPQERSERIDWILVQGGVTVDKAEVENYSEHGQFPSDHFPVVAWLRLSATPTKHE